MYVYLFEAKSIQSYLFRSGKLKDVISASERLDRLVDDAAHSTLAQVLAAANISSNLLDINTQVSDQVVGFIRCKGGAFYAYCQQQAPLQSLRSLWTLTVQQLFPSLEFADALAEGRSLAEAMNQGHPALAASRNTQPVKLPLSTAPCAHAPRTGFAAIPLTAVAKREVHPSERDEAIDLDTEQHRQGYRLLNLKNSKGKLISKFTTAPNGSSSLPESLTFPLDTEDFPGFSSTDGKPEKIRDLALIHLDGNGLGLLLRGLQHALQDCTDTEFSQAFRAFSNALAKATQSAAYQATCWLYEQQSDEQKASGMLPMRPIVLGGDDVTIFCQADLALGFSAQFCQAFKKDSQLELAALYSDYLKGSSIKPFLTASGGILYHKSTHPFTTCHQLVEGLCQEAKQATKSITPGAVNTSPATLSFYRISSALAEDIVSLRQQSQHFSLTSKQLISSLGGYLVDEDADHKLPTLAMLEKTVALLRQRDKSDNPLPLSIAKLRQMTTELARGDDEEAERIYQRALTQLHTKDRDLGKQWQQLLAVLSQQQANDEQWCWTPPAQQNAYSWISDVLTYAHFQPEKTSSTREAGAKK